MTIDPEVLKKYRRLKDATQKQVADALDMKSPTYAQKERKGDFTEKEIGILAAFFNVSKADLVSGGVEQEATEVNLDELSEQVKVMARVQRASLELLLDLQKSKPGGRSISSEILRKYGLEGIFL